MNLKNFLKSLTEIFFPRVCLGCQEKLTEKETFICKSCFEHLPLLKPPFCKICALPLKTPNTSNLCIECYRNTPFFNQAICLFRYTHLTRKLIHFFKYNHYLFLTEIFEKKLKDFVPLLSSLSFEKITYIPMHPLKLKDREYNSAKTIALLLSKVLNKPLIETLQVKEFYGSQTKLNKKERKENVEGKFSIKNLDSKKLLLVDDVLTTGSTVNEASRVLKEAGAEKVYVFALARDEIS